jgi:hypothetical protein
MLCVLRLRVKALVYLDGNVLAALEFIRRNRLDSICGVVRERVRVFTLLGATKKAAEYNQCDGYDRDYCCDDTDGDLTAR